MCNAGNSCCVCLKSGINVVNVWKTDENNVKWSSKLLTCVPDVDWIDDYCICQPCIEQLEIVCSFRQLCLHSDSVRKNFLKEEKQSSLSELLEIGYSSEDTAKEDFPAATDDETSASSVKYNHSSHISKLNCESIPKLDLYNCKHCIEKFEQYEDLTSHNKKAHKLEKPYECIVCNRSFKFGTKLREHERIHLNQHSFKCDTCSRSYNTSSLLRNHKICMHTDRSTWKYPCTHCALRFPNKSNLEKHVLRNHTNASDEWICHDCNKKCSSKVTLCLHIRYHHKKENIGDAQFKPIGKKFDCSKCGKKYTTLKILKQHLKSCNGIKGHTKPKEAKVANNEQEEDYLRCNYCYSAFKNATLLLQHVLDTHKSETQQEKPENSVGATSSIDVAANASPTNANEETSNSDIATQYACEFCPETFISDKKFVEHLVNIHRQNPKTLKPFRCRKCSNRYVHSKNMLAHQRQHEESSRNICSFCGKTFKTKGDLTVHERTHMNKRSYRCEQCNKGFNTYENLYTHNVIKHRDPSTWNYQCTICLKRFPIKSNYDYHMRRHTGDKRFECHLCSKPFITKDGVTKHMLTHTNIKLHKCEHCEKEYKNKKTLNGHLKKVHDVGDARLPVRVRKHLCSMCPKRFYDMSKLKRHLRIHTGQKPFSCYVCNKKFVDNSYVKQHLKSVHDIFDESAFV